MDVRRAIGACLPIFILALIFDITGIILLFLGIFANLRIDGRFYGDFLIYTGSIILFFSLGLWLLWYLGNVPSPYDPLTKTSSFVELARKFSQRLSEKLKTEVMGKRGALEDDEASRAGTEGTKSGRVTWGKSTAYVNKGYEQDAEEEEESEDVKSQRFYDTAVDEDHSEDLKKPDFNDTPVDEEDEDTKAPAPEESVDSEDAKLEEDTQETSFEL